MKTQNNLKITHPFKAPLSNAIRQEYNKLIDVVLRSPGSSRISKAIDGTGGKVSIADIIAYQIGWGTLLIGWYQAGLTGALPTMPGEGFTKWDYVGLAKHFYTKYQYDGSDQQLQQLHDIVSQIITICETEYSSGNLDKIGMWTWCTLPSGKQWPLSKWITVNTVAPYKRAARLIDTCRPSLF